MTDTILHAAADWRAKINSLTEALTKSEAAAEVDSAEFLARPSSKSAIAKMVSLQVAENDRAALDAAVTAAAPTFEKERSALALRELEAITEAHSLDAFQARCQPLVNAIVAAESEIRLSVAGLVSLVQEQRQAAHRAAHLAQSAGVVSALRGVAEDAALTLVRSRLADRYGSHPSVASWIEFFNDYAPRGSQR